MIDTTSSATLTRHIARESLVSAVINAVISTGFFVLVFGRLTAVPFWGPGGLIVDAAPQSFMVALMGTLVPGLLTRAAVGRGKLPSSRTVTVRRLIRSSLAVGALAAGFGVLLTAILASLVPGSAPFGPVAVAKIAYGAFLGWMVTGWSLRRLFG